MTFLPRFDVLFDLLLNKHIATIQLDVSCNELCFARLLCLETDWNIRVGKQRYVFRLTDFSNNYFETEET